MARAFTITFVVCLLMLFVISNVYATRIYKSIDAYGNVTYSSTPPDDAARTERIDIPSNFAPGINIEDNTTIDQYRDVAEELETDRKQREDEREAARKKLQEEEAKREADKPPEPVIRYYPIYLPRHYRRHDRPRKPRRHPRQPRRQPPGPEPLPAPQH